MRKSVLNSINYNSQLKSFDFVDFGCDYLSLNYKNTIDYLDDLLFGIDSDNSNFAVVSFQDKEFTFVKTPTSIGWALTFNYVYNGISFPLMQYVKFNKHTRLMVHRVGKINVYGSYFRLEEIGEFNTGYIIDFIKSFTDEDPHISRYDFRIDYFSQNVEVEIPEISKICGYLSPLSKTIEWKEGNKLIDWSVGDSDTGRYKVRYYDKKIDTDKKNKWALYSDYVKYKSVHRLEIEFLSAFCRMFTLSQIYDLQDKITQILGINELLFEGSMFYKYDSSCEITEENAGRFIQKYINLSKKLLKAGYSPYQLVEEAIIGTYGKDVAMGMLDDFLDKSIVMNELHKKYSR